MSDPDQEIERLRAEEYQRQEQQRQNAERARHNQEIIDRQERERRAGGS